MSQGLIVLDHKDRLAAAFKLGAINFGPDGCGKFGGARQIDMNRRALAQHAFDPDIAARLARKAVNHAKPQPAALAKILGGEKRLKCVGDHFGRHAGTGIGHGDFHAFAQLDIEFAVWGRSQLFIGGRDGQPAALWHGVPRIDRQVKDRGFQKRRVNHRRPQAGLHVDDAGDMFPKNGVQQHPQPFDDFLNVDIHRPQGMTPRKRQKLAVQGHAGQTGAQGCGQQFGGEAFLRDALL